MITTTISPHPIYTYICIYIGWSIQSSYTHNHVRSITIASQGGVVNPKALLLSITYLKNTGIVMEIRLKMIMHYKYM